jgi:hypothetical protein
MKPIINFAFFSCALAILIISSCTKDPVRQPDITTTLPPQTQPQQPPTSSAFGFFYFPDSVSVNELIYNNISWQMNPVNYDQVLPLDISAMTSPSTVGNTKVYLDGREVFPYWTSWHPQNSVVGILYSIDVFAKTINVSMNEFDGWAIDPGVKVSVVVKFN